MLPGSVSKGNRKFANIHTSLRPLDNCASNETKVRLCPHENKVTKSQTKAHRFMLIVAWQPDQRPPVQHGVPHQRRAHQVPVSLCSAGVDGRELTPPIGNEDVLQQKIHTKSFQCNECWMSQLNEGVRHSGGLSPGLVSIPKADAPLLDDM
jgi:hypothetical protein